MIQTKSTSTAEILRFEEREVRMIIKDGEPWWVAKDVCDILGISNARDAVAKNLKPNEKGVDTIYTLGGNQETVMVNEPGLFRLIFKSRKPEAERFQDWVYHEVLPSIRQKGSWGPTPVNIDALALIAQHMTGIAQLFGGRMEYLEEKLEAILSNQEEARQMALALPEPYNVLPGITRSEEIRQAIRWYSSISGTNIKAAYSFMTILVSFSCICEHLLTLFRFKYRILWIPCGDIYALGGN